MILGFLLLCSHIRTGPAPDGARAAGTVGPFLVTPNAFSCPPPDAFRKAPHQVVGGGVEQVLDHFHVNLWEVGEEWRSAPRLGTAHTSRVCTVPRRAAFCLKH